MDARQKALDYLNIKPRTRHQVGKYLLQKGYDAEETEAVLKELERYRYIDDTEYCRMYFEYGFEKGRGVQRIKRELSEKGVERDIIEDVLESLEDIPDQTEAAIEAARDVIAGIDTGSLGYEEKQKLKAKIGRRLAYRGFETGVIYEALERLLR